MNRLNGFSTQWMGMAPPLFDSVDQPPYLPADNAIL
jgi:hypothetical protein